MQHKRKEKKDCLIGVGGENWFPKKFSFDLHKYSTVFKCHSLSSPSQIINITIAIYEKVSSSYGSYDISTFSYDVVI